MWDLKDVWTSFGPSTESTSWARLIRKLLGHLDAVCSPPKIPQLAAGFKCRPLSYNTYSPAT